MNDKPAVEVVVALPKAYAKQLTPEQLENVRNRLQSSVVLSLTGPAERLAVEVQLRVNNIAHG